MQLYKSTETEVIFLGGKTSYESIKKYQDKAYDRLNILVQKGEKETIKNAAANAGMSLNAFVTAAIKEKIEREEKK